jgi:hypothetical protein
LLDEMPSLADLPSGEPLREIVARLLMLDSMVYYFARHFAAFIAYRGRVRITEKRNARISFKAFRTQSENEGKKVFAEIKVTEHSSIIAKLARHATGVHLCRCVAREGRWMPGIKRDRSLFVMAAAIGSVLTAESSLALIEMAENTTMGIPDDTSAFTEKAMELAAVTTQFMTLPTSNEFDAFQGIQQGGLNLVEAAISPAHGDSVIGESGTTAY